MYTLYMIHVMVKVKNPIPPTRRPTRWPTRPSTHHRHTTDASANTLPTRRPTQYRRVGRHTTDALVDTLPTRILTRYRNSYFSLEKLCLALQKFHKAQTTNTPPTHRRRISYVIKLNSCQRVGRQSVDSRPTHWPTRRWDRILNFYPCYGGFD